VKNTETKRALEYAEKKILRDLKERRKKEKEKQNYE
jgi:hypothetical protein